MQDWKQRFEKEFDYCNGCGSHRNEDMKAQADFIAALLEEQKAEIRKEIENEEPREIDCNGAAAHFKWQVLSLPSLESKK